MIQHPGQGDTSKRGFASMDQAKQREIASKGGQASGGNFKNDPARAAQAGAKGGQVSGGNFKNDPARAAQAGSQGGHARAQQSASRAAQETVGSHAAAHVQQGGGMVSKQSR